MKLLCELNDQMILGQDGLSDKPPRRAARRHVLPKFRLYSLPGGAPSLTSAEKASGTAVQWRSFDEMPAPIRNTQHDTTQKKCLQARDHAGAERIRRAGGSD